MSHIVFCKGGTQMPCSSQKQRLQLCLYTSWIYSDVQHIFMYVKINHYLWKENDIISYILSHPQTTTLIKRNTNAICSFNAIIILHGQRLELDGLAFRSIELCCIIGCVFVSMSDYWVLVKGFDVNHHLAFDLGLTIALTVKVVAIVTDGIDIETVFSTWEWCRSVFGKEQMRRV